MQVFAENPIWPSVDNFYLESYGGGTCELIRDVRVITMALYRPIAAHL